MPCVFISYSWDSEEHKLWVRNLAEELCRDGVDVILDRWDLESGKSVTMFMENAISKSDYILIICTPNYKLKADSGIGGVGYEKSIISAQALYAEKDGKVIPILRSGNWKDASPVWLLDKMYEDLSGDPYSEENYIRLLAAIHNIELPRPSVKKGKPIQKINQFYAHAADIKAEDGFSDKTIQTRDRGRSGQSLNMDELISVDDIMKALKEAETCGECKVLDYRLSQINNEDKRICHYLFHGNQRQRNYAALYFKRKGRFDLVKQAYDEGKIDRIQAFAK